MHLISGACVPVGNIWGNDSAQSLYLQRAGRGPLGAFRLADGRTQGRWCSVSSWGLGG